jgi:hypothetical protein
VVSALMVLVMVSRSWVLSWAMSWSWFSRPVVGVWSGRRGAWSQQGQNSRAFSASFVTEKSGRRRTEK